MRVYDLVRQYKGVVVWKFSQNNREVAWRLGGIGACAALSASWIKYHAHNDSLANHLRAGELGKPDVFTLNNMMFLQDSFESQKNHYSAVKGWLKMHGLIPLTVAEGTSVRPDIEYSIVTTLAKSYACYAYVVFGGKKDGHAAAIWLGGSNYIDGDACFFDPNCGEFWFESKQDFFRFFPAFYQFRRKARKAKEGWLVMTSALSNRAL